MKRRSEQRWCFVANDNIGVVDSCNRHLEGQGQLCLGLETGPSALRTQWPRGGCRNMVWGLEEVVGLEVKIWETATNVGGTRTWEQRR